MPPTPRQMQIYDALERHGWRREPAAVELAINVLTLRGHITRLRQRGCYVPPPPGIPEGCTSASIPPTRAEIAERAAAIRASWTPETRRMRHWHVPAAVAFLVARSVGRHGRERIYEVHDY